jgi:hypothetical protein
MKRIAIVTAAGLALAAMLPAAPAQAQTRVFVSAAGSDSNNCLNTMTPCRHFQQAYDKMPNGGEIDVLDPANYGAITATHTLGIVGRGWATLSPVAGQAAITINAGPSDKIAISGLTLDGANISNAIGVQLNSGASLTVRDSVIQNFTRYGILFQPNASSKISVTNTAVSDNDFGIYIGPTGSGTTYGVLDHVHTDNNTSDGITIISSTQNLSVTINESVIANNGGAGITAPGNSIDVYVRNSTINNNGGTALSADALNASISVTRSMIAENGIAFTGGGVFSYGDNNFVANGDGGGSLNPITYQ